MLNNFFQNTCKPQGIQGKIMVRMMNAGHTKLADWACTHISLEKTSHVLDVGCGGGANISRFLEQCAEGFVAGIDYSEESVKASRKNNLHYIGRNCEIKQADVSNIPYKEESFDVVTAFETVYFWPDLKENFKEVRRVLKPDGYFMICCENSDCENDTWTKKVNGMTVYSVEQLKEFLKSAGFTSVESDNKENTEWICVIAKK